MIYYIFSLYKSIILSVDTKLILKLNDMIILNHLYISNYIEYKSLHIILFFKRILII